MNGHWRAEVLPPSDRSAEALYLQGCLLRGSGVGPAGGPWGHRSRGREVSGGSNGLGDTVPTPPRAGGLDSASHSGRPSVAPVSPGWDPGLGRESPSWSLKGLRKDSEVGSPP